MFIFLRFSPAWERVMGKPNKQWGSSERVRGGAGSKRYRAAEAFVETPRQAIGDYQKGEKEQKYVFFLSWFKQ